MLIVAPIRSAVRTRTSHPGQRTIVHVGESGPAPAKRVAAASGAAALLSFKHAQLFRSAQASKCAPAQDKPSNDPRVETYKSQGGPRPALARPRRNPPLWDLVVVDQPPARRARSFSSPACVPKSKLPESHTRGDLPNSNSQSLSGPKCQSAR